MFISDITSLIEAKKLLTFKELIEKIAILERQKSQLIEDTKVLRKKAEEKLLFLECEVAVLREDAKILKRLL